MVFITHTMIARNEILNQPLALTFVPSLQLPLGCWRVPNTNTEEETTCAKLGEEEEEAAEDTVKRNQWMRIKMRAWRMPGADGGESNPWRHCKVCLIRNILACSLKILSLYLLYLRNTLNLWNAIILRSKNPESFIYIALNSFIISRWSPKVWSFSA